MNASQNNDAKAITRYNRTNIPTTASGIKLIKVSRNTYDIFTGANGFSSHSRYRFDGRWIHLAGERLNAAQIQSVGEAVGGA